MGRGSRHSKNAGTMGSEAMSYAEIRTLGYGKNHERLGKESIGNFDDCQLTFQPAIDPVCTPWGIIFSREAILSHLLLQTEDNKQKLAVYKKFEVNKSNEKVRKHEEKAQIEAMESRKLNQLGITVENNPNIHKTSQNMMKSKNVTVHSQIVVSGGVNIETNRHQIKKLKTFWGPATAYKTTMNPSITQEISFCFNKCPITGNKLKHNDLIRLRFTPVQSQTNLSNQTFKYMDPISREVFTNRSHLICFRPSGDVFSYDIFKKFVEPIGVFGGYKVVAKDLIELQKGGTGFAAHDGIRIKASKHTYLGLGPGMTDLRGQHSGAGVKSGLVLL